MAGENKVGKVTSAVYSPRLKQNIALAMVGANAAQTDSEVSVVTNVGKCSARIVEFPFYDPKKSIASS
jgi:aminomethyltransferase